MSLMIAPENIALPPSRPSSPAPQPVASTSAVTLDAVPEPAAHEVVDAPPPAYTRSAAPPPYASQDDDANAEPFTVARLLFRYGFMFPLFWFVGAFVSS
jgi:hypothetical protein